MAAEPAHFYDSTQPFYSEGYLQTLQIAAEQQAQDFQLPLNTFDNRPQVGGLVIDPKGCVDHDDAIFVQTTDKGYFIAVTISGVGEFIPYGSAIDELASLRGETTYKRNVAAEPLLPRQLSEEVFSLHEGYLCPTLTVAFETNKQMDILAVDVAKTSFMSQKDMTYEDAYNAMQDDQNPDSTMLLTAAEVADNLSKKRLGKPFTTDGIVINDQTAHKIVEEFMLLTGTAMAKWSDDHNLHVLYRNHPNRGRTPELSRDAAYYAPFNAGHKALRVPAYMQVTSPLRRAPDFQATRELSFLIDNVISPTTEDDLIRFALYANRAYGKRKGRRIS